jgi:hypothetical protein
MTNTAPIADAVSWQRLGRVTGMAGLAAVVLIFVVLVSTREEPSFTATADEFLTHIGLQTRLRPIFGPSLSPSRWSPSSGSS